MATFTEDVAISSHTSAPLITNKNEMIQEATNFLTQCYTELKKSDSVLSERLMEVKDEIQRTGTYTHTSEELTIGCKIAWRNTVNW